MSHSENDSRIISVFKTRSGDSICQQHFVNVNALIYLVLVSVEGSQKILGKFLPFENTAVIAAATQIEQPARSLLYLISLRFRLKAPSYCLQNWNVREPAIARQSTFKLEGKKSVAPSGVSGRTVCQPRKCRVSPGYW